MRPARGRPRSRRQAKRLQQRCRIGDEVCWIFYRPKELVGDFQLLGRIPNGRKAAVNCFAEVARQHMRLVGAIDSRDDDLALGLTVEQGL